MNHIDPLRDFDSFPDSALMPFKSAASIASLSVTTAYRLSKVSRFPPPIRISERITTVRFGDLREYLADPVRYGDERDCHSQKKVGDKCGDAESEK